MSPHSTRSGWQKPSLDFTATCQSWDVDLEFMATDQHQQNRVAEMTKHVILERTHAISILDAPGLPRSYWLFIASQLHISGIEAPIAVTTKPLNKIGLETSPILAHIRTLGCRCYAKATGPREKWSASKTFVCRLLDIVEAVLMLS